MARLTCVSPCAQHSVTKKYSPQTNCLFYPHSNNVREETNVSVQTLGQSVKPDNGTGRVARYRPVSPIAQETEAGKSKVDLLKKQ
jgi:hypothetical protein